MIRQSLIIGALIVLVTWFLVVWDSPPESFMRASTESMVDQSSVDSFMLGVTSRRFSPEGNEIFLITSSKMELLTNDPRILLTNPRFVSVTNNADGKDTGISFVANSGVLSRDDNQLSLKGNVEAVIAGVKNTSTLSSSSLEYNAHDLPITTDQYFEFKTPTLLMQGTGLSVDLKQEIFRIMSNISANHDVS